MSDASDVDSVCADDVVGLTADFEARVGLADGGVEPPVINFAPGEPVEVAAASDVDLGETDDEDVEYLTSLMEARAKASTDHGEIRDETDDALRTIAANIDADKLGQFINEDGITMTRVHVSSDVDKTFTTKGFEAIKAMSGDTPTPTTEVLNHTTRNAQDSYLISTRPSTFEGPIPDRTTRDKTPMPTSSTRPCEFCAETYKNSPVLAMSKFNTIKHEWCSQMCAWNWCHMSREGGEIRPMILSFLRRVRVAPLRMSMFVDQFSMRHFHTTKTDLASGVWSGVNPEGWRDPDFDVQVKSLDEKCSSSATLVLARESQRAMRDTALSARLDDSTLTEEERAEIEQAIKAPKTLVLLGPMCNSWLDNIGAKLPHQADVESAVKAAIESRTLRTSVFAGGKVEELPVPENTVPMERMATGVPAVLDVYERQRAEKGSHEAVDLSTNVPVAQTKANARRTLKSHTPY